MQNYKIAYQILRQYARFAPWPMVDEALRSGHFNSVLSQIPEAEREAFMALEKMCSDAFSLIHQGKLADSESGFKQAWQIIGQMDGNGPFYDFALTSILSRSAYLTFRQGDFAKAKEGLARSFDNLRLNEVSYASPLCRMHAVQIFCHFLQVDVKLKDYETAFVNACSLIRYIITGEAAGLQKLPDPWGKGWENLLPDEFPPKYQFENNASMCLLNVSNSLLKEHDGKERLLKLLKECERSGSELLLDRWLAFEWTAVTRPKLEADTAAIDVMMGLTQRFRHNLTDAIANMLEKRIRSVSRITLGGI